MSPHPLRAVLEAAEHDLLQRVPGGRIGLEFWGTSRSAEAHLGWLDRYALLLERALPAQQFAPLEMPQARSPPKGELLLAWALHRTGTRLAVFPECARVEPGIVDLGATGGSDTCTVYRGPLHLEGSVRCTGTVVVVGNLTVDGLLTDGWSSDSALVVIGNEQVRVMAAAGDHIVTGDLDARVLHIRSEASSIVCGGKINARAVISEHWAAAEGRDFVVRPNDLAALLDRLSPRPDASLELESLVAGLGTGRWQLT